MKGFSSKSTVTPPIALHTELYCSTANYKRTTKATKGGSMCTVLSDTDPPVMAKQEKRRYNFSERIISVRDQSLR